MHYDRVSGGAPQLKEGFAHMAADGLGEYNKFYIYNYLPNHSIRIEAIPPTEDRKDHRTLIRVPAKGSKELSMPEAIKHFRKGSHIKIYTKGSDQTEKLYCQQVFDVKEDQMVKALHVGMVTTRIIGGKRQNSGLITSSNAVQGMPFVDIHNLTSQKICLGDTRFSIEIPPNGYYRFKGCDHFGVRLGTIFKDNDNVYSDFQLNRTVTDIYYGVVSDIQQPIYGGWQMEFDTNPVEASYLFADGWY